MARPTAWDLPQIQKQLLVNDDAVLVEYSLGTENSYAFVVTEDEFASYKLAPRSEIEPGD